MREAKTATPPSQSQRMTTMTTTTRTHDTATVLSPCDPMQAFLQYCELCPVCTAHHGYELVLPADTSGCPACGEDSPEWRLLVEMDALLSDMSGLAALDEALGDLA